MTRYGYRCPFCERSRTSVEALLSHLVFWHNLSEQHAQRAVRNPVNIPDWVRPEMDERNGRLVQDKLL